MIKSKKIILFVLIIMLISINFIAHSEQNSSNKIAIDENEKVILFKGNEIKYDNNLYKTALIDLTADGIEELIIATKKDGTASLLDYKIYKIEDNNLNIIFEKCDIYKGELYIEDNKIIEKTPFYHEDDPNGSPSYIIKDEYVYIEDTFVLQNSSKKPFNNKKISKLSNNYYKNPSKEEIERIIEKVAIEKRIPPIILKSIAYTESRFNQFVNGEPYSYITDNESSFGLMQVNTKAHTNLDEERLKYDIEYNIRAGADILKTKWSYGFPNQYRKDSIIPLVGDGSSDIIENWYFAVWAYNGWSRSNNPNELPIYYKNWTKKEAYQDTVIRFAKEIFEEDITKINKALLPKYGLPDENKVYKTPDPTHNFTEFNNYQKGDILISTSGSLSLRNDKWSKIDSLNLGQAMIILEEPVVFGGYTRYKIKTIEENEEDIKSGWVSEDWTRIVQDADLNFDEIINYKDLNLLINNLGKSALLDEYNKFDLNNDDLISPYDIKLFFNLIEEINNIELIYDKDVLKQINVSNDDNKINYKAILKSNYEVIKIDYFIDDNGKTSVKYKTLYNNDGSINYKEEYKEGKLIVKSIHTESGIVNYNYEYEYNKDGSLNNKKVYVNNKLNAKFVYTKDSNGKDIYKYKYGYKVDGTLNYRYIYKDGKVVANYIYKKDDKGNDVYKYKYGYKSDGTLNFKYIYKDGKIIASYIYTKDAKGKYIYKYKYVYYEDGTINYKYVFKDGDLICNYIYTLDKNGKYQYKYKIGYKEDGTLNNRYVYRDGKLIVNYLYTIDDKGKYSYKYKFTIDSTGKNYVKRFVYQNGKFILDKTY